MKRILLAMSVCAAVGLSAGCEKLSWGKKSDEPEPVETAEQRQIRQLQAEAATLKDTLAVRDAEVKDLRQRNEALSKKVRRLEFLTERQEKQIEVLAQAPLARDEYKTLCEDLKKSLQEVTARLAKLEAANKLLTLQLKMAAKQPDEESTTTRPATRPVVPPEPEIIAPSDLPKDED